MLLFLAAALLSAQSPEILQKERDARRLIAAGRAAEAIPLYEQIVAEVPNNAVLRTNLAVALFTAARYVASAEQSREVLRLDPGAQRARLLLGAALSRLGELEEAAPHLAEAVRAQPADRNARLMLAEALLGLERYDQALIHFREAVALLPENPRAWYGLAWSCHALERRDGFCAAAAERLEALPPSPQLHEWRARLLAERQQHLQAAEEWRRALALAPDDPQLTPALAVALYRASDFSGALPLLEEQARQQPRSAQWRFLLGSSLLHLARAQEAIPHLEAAVEVDPELLAARADLGQAYLETDQPARALPHLRAAVALDEDGALYYRLANAYRRLGDLDAARAALEQASEAMERAREP